MNTLETQVVKIQLGNIKTANTFVYLLAEEAGASGAELYLITELPVFNPAAIPECEKIAKAIAGSLLRSYQLPLGESSFENALALINEELSKLAQLGLTHWVGKLNAVIAVKSGQQLHFATTGKITAVLLREGKTIDIAGEAVKANPLKTFENFAAGKVKELDILLFSNTELLNHISLERAHNLLIESSPTEAAAEMVRILKDNTGPESSIATLIARLQAPVATTLEIAPKISIAVTPESSDAQAANSKLETLKLFIAQLFRKPKLPLFLRPKLGETHSWNIKHFFSKQKPLSQKLESALAGAKNSLRFSGWSGFSKTKKFFLISALVLLLAVVTNIIIAHRYQLKQKQVTLFTNSITEVEKQITDAQNALLLNDRTRAKSIAGEAKKALAMVTAITPEQKDARTKTADKIMALEASIENRTQVSASAVGQLSASNSLINLPDQIATQNGTSILSWNKQSQSVLDGALKSSESIIASRFIKNQQVIVYTGASLQVWNYATGTFSKPFSQSVPAQNEFGGLDYYPANNKVYMINTALNQIVVFSLNDTATEITKVVIWTTAGNLKFAKAMAIDGNVYAVTPEGISLYKSGKLVDFPPLDLPSPLSDKLKLFTTIGSQNVYILDSGNNRIVVADKKGVVQKILSAPQFTNIKDFVVEEKSNTIYVLNESSLLKLTY